ncbi:MAG: hypothetical protein KBT46_00430 [Ruminococcus sp.]|nr:hypothetical protein [Candidatus Copronaster equi]
MSIISNNEKIKKEARRDYENKIVKMRTVENNAMNEMLNILRVIDHPMTASQIEAACTSGISKYEIAGNLRAMKNANSRYLYHKWCFCQRLPDVDIPYRNTDERIVTKGGGKREAVVVELDENNHIIPNSKRKVMLNESKLYEIEKIK